MRTGTRVIGAVALLVAVTVAVPTAAGAATKEGELYACLVEAFGELEGIEGDELQELTLAEVEEGIEGLDSEQKRELDRAAQSCYSSPNPVIPAEAELIWGSLAFLIVAGGLMWLAFPMIKRTLASRQDKIREELEGAEAARAAAEKERSDYDSKLAEARAESTRIIDEAREAGEGVKREMVAAAEQEAAAIRERANQDASAAQARALSEIQQQVGTISIELAEKIVNRNIDPAAQQELIEQFISDVGRTN